MTRLALLKRNDGLDPASEVWHLGVDAILALLSAAFAKTGDPVDGPPAVFLTQQWTSGISGAGVDPATLVAGAEHVVADVVILVDVGALLCRHDRDLEVDEEKISRD